MDHTSTCRQVKKSVSHVRIIRQKWHASKKSHNYTCVGTAVRASVRQTLSGAYLKKYQRYKLETSQVDRSHWGLQCTRTITLAIVFFSTPINNCIIYHYWVIICIPLFGYLHVYTITGPSLYTNIGSSFYISLLGHVYTIIGPYVYHYWAIALYTIIESYIF